MFDSGRQFSGFWALLRTLLLIASICCAPFGAAAAVEAPCPGHESADGVIRHHQAHKPSPTKHTPVDKCCIGGLQAPLLAPAQADVFAVATPMVLKRPLVTREPSGASFLPETLDRPPRIFA